MPNLLVAPSTPNTAKKENPYAPYEPKSEGFYSDGAYVAIPSKTAFEDQYEDSEIDSQEAYYMALLERFDGLRSTLATSPPSSAPQIDQAVRSLLGKPRPGPWKHALLKSQPTPVLLSILSQENTICGIEVLESLLTMKNMSRGVRHRLGAWAWGLLGRCRGVSEMDSEDVSVLRGLGKKACALLRRLQAGEELYDGDEEGEAQEDFQNINGKEGINRHGNDDGENNAVHHGKLDETGGEDEKVPEDAMPEHDTHVNEIPGDQAAGDSQTDEISLEEARKRLLAGISSADQAPLGDSNGSPIQKESANFVQVSDAHATLDLIVTLVGECYGQRDLLDARLAWEEL